jgi:hypothetical protein
VQPYRGPGRGGVRRGLAAMDRVGLTGREADLGGSPSRYRPVGEDDVFFPATWVSGSAKPCRPPPWLLPGCSHFLPGEVPETRQADAQYLRARYLMEPHGHDQKEGVVMLRLERRPPRSTGRR